MRIVLVDDESLIRMDLRDVLEQAGHTVVGEGRNGVEALALLRKERPDVVLMDVKMPELDGIEAARQMHRLRIAPVVLLTAYSQEDLVQKAMGSGVYGYLVKPVREEQIVPALCMARARFEAEQALVEEASAKEESVEERKAIARATGILMAKQQLSEEEAYRRLRKFCMDKGRTMASVAAQIIEKYSHKK